MTRAPRRQPARIVGPSDIRRAVAAGHPRLVARRWRPDPA